MFLLCTLLPGYSAACRHSATAQRQGKQEKWSKATGGACEGWPAPAARRRSRRRRGKLAGAPPCILMMSIVAMASPAPFTMHPMLPSRPM